jgi:hypothetical protein
MKAVIYVGSWFIPRHVAWRSQCKADMAAWSERLKCMLGSRFARIPTYILIPGVRYSDWNCSCIFWLSKTNAAIVYSNRLKLLPLNCLSTNHSWLSSTSFDANKQSSQLLQPKILSVGLYRPSTDCESLSSSIFLRDLRKSPCLLPSSDSALNGNFVAATYHVKQCASPRQLNSSATKVDSAHVAQESSYIQSGGTKQSITVSEPAVRTAWNLAFTDILIVRAVSASRYNFTGKSDVLF